MGKTSGIPAEVLKSDLDAATEILNSLFENI